MDRNNQNSFIIARIGSDQPVSRSDAGKDHLGAADKRLCIIDNGKRYIVVFLEPADEVSLLPLMSKKSHMDFPLRFHGLNTEQSGPARVSESHKSILFGIPLSQVSDCQCRHSSGSHCRHPVSIHKGKFLSGHGIEEHYATFQRRHPVGITVNHLHAIDLLVRNIRRHCIHKDIVRKVDAYFCRKFTFIFMADDMVSP